MENKNELTAPCGLDCFNCEIQEENLSDEFAQLIHEKIGIPKDQISCKGCRQQEGNHFHLPSGGCATLNCVKAKGVDLCCNCGNFPCALLAPISDGATKYPHNMKIYNLCRIKNIGLENWIEEAGDIRKKYFTGQFVVGKGQSE